MRLQVLAAIAFAGLFVTAGAAQKKPAVGHSRRIFANVTDSAGAPVLDLKPEHFEIREGAKTQRVLAASLGSSPMRIALMVDTSDATDKALNHMRAGLGAFLDALPPEAEVLIVTTGRQVRVRVQPTTDRKKLKDLTNGLFSDGGATPLRDGLMEIDDRFFKKAPDRWPLFVIVTGDGAESSSEAIEKRFNTWLNDLPARGISAHGFALKYRGGGVPDAITQQVVQMGGGMFDFMNTSNSLPDKLKALGERLAADAKLMSTWYQLDFETSGNGSQAVDVLLSRSGVTVTLSNVRATSGRP